MIIKPILYLILAALVIAILLTWLGAGFSLFFGGQHLEFFMTQSTALNYLFVFQVFLLISIPVLLLILSLYGLLRNRSRSIKPLKRKMDAIWVVNIVLLFCWVVFMVKDMSYEHNHLTSDTLQKTTTPISLDVSSMELEEGVFRVHTPLFKMDDGHFYQHANLSILQSTNDQIIIERKQQARGEDSSSAKTRIEAMNYPFTLDSLSIHLADYFEINKGEKWRGHFMTYTLKLPIGQQIVIPDISRYHNKEFFLIDNSISPNRYEDKTWEMTETGLKCIDCQTI